MEFFLLCLIFEASSYKEKTTIQGRTDGLLMAFLLDMIAVRTYIEETYLDGLEYQ